MKFEYGMQEVEGIAVSVEDIVVDAMRPYVGVPFSGTEGPADVPNVVIESTADIANYP